MKKNRINEEKPDQDMTEKEKLEIHPGLNLLREYEKGNIYPQGILRLMVKDNFIKITGNYGFSIVADITKAQESLEALNWADGFSYEEMAQRFRVESGEFRVFVDDRTAELMREISGMLEKGNDPRLRLKVMEAVICIFERGIRESQRLPVLEECTPSQAVMARSVYSYMMNHMDRHITIDVLSQVFGVSPTQIKVSFKSYYGESVRSFMRKEKLHVAAGMLKETDRPVAQIAENCGYSSPGKFSKAFFELMMVTPREYRSQL